MWCPCTNLVICGHNSFSWCIPVNWQCDYVMIERNTFWKCCALLYFVCLFTVYCEHLNIVVVRGKLCLGVFALLDLLPWNHGHLFVTQFCLNLCCCLFRWPCMLTALNLIIFQNLQPEDSQFNQRDILQAWRLKYMTAYVVTAAYAQNYEIQNTSTAVVVSYLLWKRILCSKRLMSEEVRGVTFQIRA